MIRTWLLVAMVFGAAVAVAQIAQAEPDAEQVVNGDFSFDNTGFTTEYGTGSCFNARNYRILADAHGCHPSWHGSDHTTGSGQFMAVNGASQAGPVVWSENIQVVPGATYALRLFVSTLFVGSPPPEWQLATLSIAVNGVHVGTIQAPNTLSAWKEFSVSWSAGAATNALVTIVDTNLAGTGNDFGLDDVSFFGPTPTTPTTNRSWGQVKLMYR